MKIKNLIGFSALDSRGRPTVAAQLTLEDDRIFTVRVPSGASTGKHEALELRDSDGRGVDSAVSNLNKIISPKVVGQEADIFEIDRILIELDPTPNHQNLGANATLATSLAVAKASGGDNLAKFFTKTGPLLIPMPMVNILSGGAHAGKVMDIQDVLIIPNGANNFRQALNWIVEVRECAAIEGKSLGITHLIADEGGLGLPFKSIGAACEFIARCIEKVGLKPLEEVSIALDVAATQFFDGENYQLKNEASCLSPKEFIEKISKLVTQNPIISIEDPFAEDDWQTWQEFMAGAPGHLQVIGDDLFTTNLDRLANGISNKSANAILIKPNQNGLVSKTYEVLTSAKAAGFKTIVSARSGETEDSWLSDLAVGFKAGQIKVGSTHGSDRTAKWNRLLELEASCETTFAKPFNLI